MPRNGLLVQILLVLSSGPHSKGRSQGLRQTAVQKGLSALEAELNWFKLAQNGPA